MTQHHSIRDFCTVSPLEDAIRLQPRSDTDAAKLFAPRYRDASARELYGSEAILVRPQQPAASEPLPTDNALFQGFLLLVGVAFVLLVYHNIADVRTLLNHTFRDPASDKRSFQEPSGSRYTRLLRTTTAIGFLFIGILAVRCSQPYAGLLPAAHFSFAATLLLCIAVALAGGVVAGVQALVLRAVGAITLTQSMLTQLRQLRMRYFAAAVVLVAAPVMLYVLTPAEEGFLWFVLMIIGLVVTLFLYLRETLTLFLAKKVSFVHWFLYLCCVELFPVSLLWQLAVR